MTRARRRAGHGWRCCSSPCCSPAVARPHPAHAAGQGGRARGRRRERQHRAARCPERRLRRVDDQHAEPKPSGTVIHQNPAAGDKGDQGSTVTLTVSSGPGNDGHPRRCRHSVRPGQEAARGPASATSAQWSRRPRRRSRPADVIDTVPRRGHSVAGRTRGRRCIVSSGQAAGDRPRRDGAAEPARDSALQRPGSASRRRSRPHRQCPGHGDQPEPGRPTPRRPRAQGEDRGGQGAPTTAKVPTSRDRTAAPRQAA